MRGFLDSLYGRISLLYLVLLLGFGAACTWMLARSFEAFVEELTQRANRELAQNLGRLIEPALREGPASPAVREAVRRIHIVRPELEIYMLDQDGRILAAFGGAGQVRLTHVSTGPIQAFLGAQPRFPLRGDDPRDPGEDKIFSAAVIAYQGDARGYLYILLHGTAFRSTAEAIRSSYVLRSLGLSLLLTLLFTAIAGSILFFLMTRRLRRLTHTVEQFKQGAYDRRVEAPGEDEIGRLGRAFNELAAMIEAQVSALQQTDEARRDMVANISHDLRTPLTSARGYIERMLMSPEPLSREMQQQYLGAVLNNVVHLEQLVRQLGDLARLDAGHMVPRFEAFPISELAQDLIVKLRPEAEARGVHLEAAYSPDLPWVVADISLIERVLTNLLDNALQNTPAGGTVQLGLHAAPDHVQVHVTDTGVGIPPEELPLVTRRFYRTARSRAQAAAGSGLGLAIAQEILALHGSTIEIESAPGKGTTVRFRVPPAE